MTFAATPAILILFHIATYMVSNMKYTDLYCLKMSTKPKL